MIFAPAVGGLQYAEAKPASIDMIYFAGPAGITIEVGDKKGNALNTYPGLSPGDSFQVLPKSYLLIQVFLMVKHLF